MNSDPEAAGRVRHVLSDRDGAVEKRIVGGLSFLSTAICAVASRVGRSWSGLVPRAGSRRSGSRTCGPMQLRSRALSGFICVEPCRLCC